MPGEPPRQGPAADAREKQDAPQAEHLRLAEAAVHQHVLAEEDQQRVERRQAEERRRLVERGLVQHQLIAVVQAGELGDENDERQRDKRGGLQGVIAEDGQRQNQRERRPPRRRRPPGSAGRSRRDGRRRASASRRRSCRPSTVRRVGTDARRCCVSRVLESALSRCSEQRSSLRASFSHLLALCPLTPREITPLKSPVRTLAPLRPSRNTLFSAAGKILLLRSEARGP